MATPLHESRPVVAQEQIALPFDVGAAAPVLVRNARARRYVLRLAPDGTPRVTIPRHGTRAEALQFVERQRDWIARQRTRLGAQRRPGWRPGDRVWWRGLRTPIVAVPRPGGRVELTVGDVRLTIGGSLLDLPADLRGVLARAMCAIAATELPRRLGDLAASDDLTVARVVIRDQRTRWGSCARGGVISLNWRLVQMPDHVRDYVLWHELMHVRVANHSPRFWAQVARVCPTWRDARLWLRREGRSL